MNGSARHIAVVAPPTPGHLNPLQVLAGELRALGHRVTFVHVDGVQRVLKSGLVDFSALPGPDGAQPLDRYLEVLANPNGPLGFARMIRTTAAMSARLLDGLPGTLERIGADALLADSVEPAGALVARRLGLPFVSTVTGLPLLRDDAIPPPFVGWKYLAGRRGAIRNRGGYRVAGVLMRPIRRVIVERARAWGIPASQSEALSPLLQVAQCPSALDFPRSALPSQFRYGSPWREAQGDIEPLATDDARPLIFCSLGTLQGARIKLFARMAEACAVAGARAVIGHGGGLSDADASGLPGDPLVRAFWPQAGVLRQCSGAVLHGGFNSVLDALAEAVPMVVAPIAFEQPGTAARVAWTGAGRVVPATRLTVPALAAALRAILNEPSYKNAAERLRDKMSPNGAAEAASAVNEVLRRP